MYRLFLCILLNEVKKSSQGVKKKFFDAHVSTFLSENTRDDIHLAQIYAFNVCFIFVIYP